MAQSLDTARKRIKTSGHGRRLGIDRDEFLVGVKDIVKVVNNATITTTGTNLLNHGFHTVASTTTDTWVLDDPIVGCEVTIATGTTSTGLHAIVPVAAKFNSTNGIAGSSIILQGAGASITLIGLTTALWQVKSITPITTSAATVQISS